MKGNLVGLLAWIGYVVYQEGYRTEVDSSDPNLITIKMIPVEKPSSSSGKEKE